MSADFNKPALDDAYTDVLPSIRDNQTAVAVMFNTGAAFNTPINSVQFLNGAFALFNGSSFDIAAITIAGGGTGSTTAAGVRTNLDVLSTAQLNSNYMRQDANGSDIVNTETFRLNIGVPSKIEAALNADNLVNLGNAASAFSNIKQDASISVSGVVEKATTAEAEAGTTSKFPDAAGVASAIQARGRTPIIIFTGSTAEVDDGEILASSGFIVVPGTYILTISATVFTIIVTDVSVHTAGTSSFQVVDTPTTNNLEITYSERVGGVFRVRNIKQSNNSINVRQTTKVEFIPL